MRRQSVGLFVLMYPIRRELSNGFQTGKPYKIGYEISTVDFAITYLSSVHFPARDAFNSNLFFVDFALQDVSNANVRSGNTSKNGKPAVAKRANGVKTRSMSIGNTNNELVLAPVPRSNIPGAFNNNESRNAAPLARETFGKGRSMADPKSYQMTGSADDIDERDKDDPLCATDYVVEMYEWYREKEVSSSVRPTFMENQPHINQRMRAILVDWLVEVHAKFKLVPETLYLTINLIDRFLELEVVTRPKLQLIGVTALLIASKYEEIYPPELRDLVYICTFHVFVPVLPFCEQSSALTFSVLFPDR